MRRKLIYLISFVLVLSLAADVASGLEVKINFQPERTEEGALVPVPEGYWPDYGYEFGDRGKDFPYGWNEEISWDTRWQRKNFDDIRKDTLIEVWGASQTWEIELPNGLYDVFVFCGDPRYDDQINTFYVEGNLLEDPDGRDNYDDYKVTVLVKDGRLTIQGAPGDVKRKFMFLHITSAEVPKAYDPDPEDGATHPDTSVTLTWLPGYAAISHDVYLGTNWDDVNDANNTDGLWPEFRGNQDPCSYETGPLELDTTYYWRIDEYDGVTTHKGNVWSFKIPGQKAYDSAPPDGAIFVELDADLSWAAGLGAELHNVYFGTNPDSLSLESEVQAATTYDPGILNYDTTYYWRIDEFDGTDTYTGDVWSFTTIPSIPVTDPNLLCWWKFDKSSDTDNTFAIDYSGYDHHGVIYGASLVSNGQVREALNFGGDGDYVVDEDAEEYLNGLSAITVCMWIKSNEIGTERGFINCVHPNTKDEFVSMRYNRSGMFWGGVNVVRMGLRSTVAEEPEESDRYYLESSSYVQTKNWQHVAMTWIGGKAIRFYINGKEDTPTGTSDPFETGSTITKCKKLIIGKGSEDVGGEFNGWNGLIDDVRIYNKVLTANEIKEVMRGELDLAWNPSPANFSTPDIHHALPLSWSPGDFADQHDVYFGTDRDAVADANASDTTGIYRRRQADTSYTPPEGVEWGGGPYYWRIDEYNTDETISKGRIWQFTVADFILMDGFEDYNNNPSERIFETWRGGYGYTIYENGIETGTYCGNGTGSMIGHDADPKAGEYYVETTIVNSGEQSMPFYYDNSATGYNKCNLPINLYYSEAKRTLDYPRDWTEQGVKALTLWFRGYAASFKEGPVGTYTMTASGRDISGTSDEFRYVYKQLSGAGSIEAQVLSIQNTHQWAKAGVMIRRRLDYSGSTYAAVYITPGHGCRFQARLNQGEEHSSDTQVATSEQEAITAPYWVKIERDSSSNFYGYYSSNGVNWQEMAWNPQYILMPPNVYIGLALTSHNVNAVCKAQFSDVKLTGSVTPDQIGGWTNLVIPSGTTMFSNEDPEPMYVAVANNTGPPAVVSHKNPDAAQIDAWTPWNIPLKDLEVQGLNLTDVNSIAIGFGDRDNPQAGGSGLMYFDDIRLYRSRCVPDELTLSEADLNSDCVVDFRDLKIIAGDWLDSGLDLAADLNADSTVDLADYAVLANQWLEEKIWPAL